MTDDVVVPGTCIPRCTPPCDTHVYVAFATGRTVPSYHTLGIVMARMVEGF
jgi:hypothetical protein